MSAALRPYVPRLVADWLARDPDRAYQQVDGTLVLADISGFTALTEQLAARGRAGAEEMGDLLNRVFTQLLDAAYAYDAGLLKWGGDSALLLFDGPKHPARAARAADSMQRVLRRHGRLTASCGRVRLAMSVGVHSGPIDLFLVGSGHRELLPVGEAATKVASLESAAVPGQVLLSATAASLLPPGSAQLIASADGAAVLLRPPPATPSVPRQVDPTGDGRLASVVPPPLAEHILAGDVEPDHRHVATAFVGISGTDSLLRRRGPTALASALGEVVALAASTAESYGVTLLGSDVAAGGGKLILVAGAPSSVGDLEQRALCAARAVVDGADRLPLRAGVASGRVFAGDYGPPYRRTFSVVGDSVNLAARLMAAARPGQVVASRAVVQASRARFSCTPLPPLPVKGKSRPVEAVTVDALPHDAAPVETGATTPFLGRETDLVALWASWDAAASGSGRVVDLVGEPGMGKTRLVSEWRRTADLPMIVASCDPYGAARPYWPIGTLLRNAIGDLSLSGAAALDWLGEQLRERRPELLAWLPLAGPILGVRAELPAELAQLSEQLRLARVADLVVAAFDAVCPTPTVLVVGDLHYADAASVEVLRRLSAAVPARPWLLLLTRRPDGPTICEVDAAHASTLWLVPLPDKAATDLVERLTEAAPLPRHDVRRLVELAGGNPLFLTELTLRGTGDGDLPLTVEDAVAARLDRLPPRARSALRALAVLGTSCQTRVVESLFSAAGVPVEALSDGALAQYLDRTDSSVRFRQPVVRDAAYAGLPFRRRRELHALAAEALRRSVAGDELLDGLLSVHHEAAGQYEQAYLAASRAAEHAREAYARVEAATFLARAAAAARRVPTLRQRLAAGYADLGRALVTIGSLDSGQAALLTSRRHDSSPQHRAATAEALAEVAALRGQLEATLRWVRIGLRDLAGVSSGPDRARFEVRLCIHAAWARLKQGRYREVTEWAAWGIAAATPPTVEAAELYRARSLAVRGIGGAASHQDAVRDLEQAMALLEGSDRRSLRARVANDLGSLAHLQGHWQEAVAGYRQAGADLLALGEEWAAAVPEANLAEILIDQGRYDEALASVRGLLRVFRAAGMTNMVGHTLKLQGLALFRNGAPAAGLDRLQEARDLFVADQDQAAVAEVDVRLSLALATAGRPLEGLALSERLLATPPVCASWQPALHRSKGVALALLGRPEEGLAELELAVGAARADGAEHEVAFSLAAVASLRQTRGQEAGDAVSELDRLAAALDIKRYPVLFPAVEPVPA